MTDQTAFVCRVTVSRIGCPVVLNPWEQLPQQRNHSGNRHHSGRQSGSPTWNTCGESESRRRSRRFNLALGGGADRLVRSSASLPTDRPAHGCASRVCGPPSGPRNARAPWRCRARTSSRYVASGGGRFAVDARRWSCALDAISLSCAARVVDVTGRNGASGSRCRCRRRYAWSARATTARLRIVDEG